MLLLSFYVRENRGLQYVNKAFSYWICITIPRLVHQSPEATFYFMPSPLT